ncbi:MAG: hypothetical protein PHQ43_00200 [Dehalococcoidales bacterium]|nr:hypothetical protein [Dehalococcoidales bacterium]
MIEKITLGGVAVTSYVYFETLVIESQKGAHLKTCTFDIKDPSAVVTISDLQAVAVTDTAGTTKYFAGVVADYDIEIDGITLIYHLRCQGYALLLSTAYYAKVYATKTDADIIADAVAAALPEISTAGISESSGTHDTFVMNHMRLDKMIDTLADAHGKEWYVDDDKLLHYHDPEESYAPYSLSSSPDNATSFPYYDLRYSKDATGIANRITVVGGNYKTDDITEIYPSNGTQTKFKLHNERVQAPSTNPTRIVVEKNTGSDGSPSWTAQTVGIDQVDTLGTVDVLFNVVSSTLEFNTAPSNLVKGWRITYRYLASVSQTVRSQDSYDDYGRWYDYKIVNKDILSNEEAEQIGRAYLNEHCYGKHVITCRTTQAGFEVGQKVWFVNGLLSLARYLTISKVKATILLSNTGASSQIIEYEITMAGSTPNDTVIDNLADLNDKVNHHDYNPDEVVSNLFDFADSTTLEDTAVAHSESGLKYYCKAVEDSETIKCGYWVCRA